MVSVASYWVYTRDTPAMADEITEMSRLLDDFEASVRQLTHSLEHSHQPGFCDDSECCGQAKTDFVNLAVKQTRNRIFATSPKPRGRRT